MNKKLIKVLSGVLILTSTLGITTGCKASDDLDNQAKENVEDNSNIKLEQLDRATESILLKNFEGCDIAVTTCKVEGKTEYQTNIVIINPELNLNGLSKEAIKSLAKELKVESSFNELSASIIKFYKEGNYNISLHLVVSDKDINCLYEYWSDKLPNEESSNSKNSVDNSSKPRRNESSSSRAKTSTKQPTKVNNKPNNSSEDIDNSNSNLPGNGTGWYEDGHYTENGDWDDSPAYPEEGQNYEDNKDYGDNIDYSN